jgi:D-alanine-D-alanine ligase
MKVLVLHSLPPVAPANGRHVWEFDLSAAAEGIREVMPDAIVAGVRGEVDEVLSVLSKHRPDVVFNLCEAPLGRPDRESHAAALLEWLGMPFTGSRSETLALCRRKDRVNSALLAAGVPMPRSGVFPCIVKPSDEHSSAGLDDDSVCADAEAVAAAIARWDGPLVIQEFLPGREFAIALWGRTSPDHFSIGETCFQKGLRLNTYSAKWDIESPDFANSPLSYCTEIESSLKESMRAAANDAWHAVGACGYLRVDLRLDDSGAPRVIDVNANPELSPEVGMHRAVTETGWTWERFVRQQIEWAH